MDHTHRFYAFGSEFVCSCGASKPDTRTDAERSADMERSTIAFKIRANKAMGVDSPKMRAYLAR